ncbi:hypothetical protein LTS18_003925, partial [Coniosporium uncinatum]
RQLAGSRGGAAAKKAARLRRFERLRETQFLEQQQATQEVQAAHGWPGPFDTNPIDVGMHAPMHNHSSNNVIVPSIETSAGPSSPYFLSGVGANALEPMPAYASSARYQPQTRCYTPGTMHEDSPTSRYNPSVYFPDLGGRSLVESREGSSDEQPMTPESCAWGQFDGGSLFDPAEVTMQ